MREFFAAKATTSIKVQIFHTVGKWSGVNAGSFGTFKEGTEEYNASVKVDKFINDHLEKDLKTIMPMKWNGMKSTEKQIKKFYDPLYNGVIRFLGTDKFNDFFEGKFSIDKIDDNGGYEGFRNFGVCHYVLNINEILHCVDDKMTKFEGDDSLKKKVNKAFQDFQNGVGGEQSIDNLYGFMNSLVNELGGTTEQIQQRRESEAWQSIGNPVMSKGGYNCYCVRKWEDLNAVAGFTNWCVAQSGHSGKSYFDGANGYIYPNYDEEGKPTQYIENKRNAYYLICEGRKPVALFNISTKGSAQCQFKNTGDHRFELDRPSSKDVVGIGYELRKYLGSKSYNGDFEIFKEYKEKGKDFEPDWKMDLNKLEKNPSIVEIPIYKEDLLEKLEKGWDWDWEFVSKNLFLIDKVPEIKNVLLEGIKSGKCLHCANNHPSLFENKDIRNAFVEKLKEGDDDLWELIGQKNKPLFDYPEVKSLLLEELKNGKRWTLIRHVPSLIDKVPEIKALLLDALKSKRYSWNIIYDKPYLINENPEIKRLLLDNLKKGEDWGVVQDNPFLVDDVPEIKSLLPIGLKKKYCWKVIEDNPSLLDEFPEAKAFFPKISDTIFYWNILYKKPSLVNEIPEIKSKLLDGLKNGYCWKFIDENPFLLEDSEIKSLIPTGLKSIDNSNRYNAEKIWNIIKTNPSIIKDVQDVKSLFLNELEKGRNWYIVVNNPSIIEDVPEVKSLVLEELENARHWDIVIKNPSVVDNNPEIKNILLDELRAGGMWHVVKDNPSIIDKVPEIKTLLPYGLKKGFWEIVEKKPSLVETVPEVKTAFLERLKTGYGWDIVQNNTSLIRTVPELRTLFLEILKKGYCWYVLNADSSLLKDKEIMNLLLERLETGHEWDLLSQNPSFFENPEIKNVLLEKLEKRLDYWDVVKNNLSLISDIPEVRNLFIEELKKGRNWVVVANNSFLFDNIPEIKAVLLEYLKKGDWNIIDFFPSFIDKIPKEINELLPERLKKEGKGFNILERNSLFLENPEIIKLLPDVLKKGSGWDIVLKNPSLLENPEIKSLLPEELKKGYCWDAVKENASLVDEIPEIKNLLPMQLKQGSCWSVIEKKPNLVNEVPEIKRFLIEELKIGNLWNIVYNNPSFLEIQEIRNVFLERVKQGNVKYYFIKTISDVKLLKQILDANPTNGIVRTCVLDNESKDIDEGKLYKLCKEFANKDYNFLNKFFNRYHAMSDSESFQNDFWNYIEKSNYLFDVIKNHFDQIPQERMERYAQSSDRDVNWIANKLKKPSLPESEKKASRIARRICLPDIIAERIVLGK